MTSKMIWYPTELSLNTSSGIFMTVVSRPIQVGLFNLGVVWIFMRSITPIPLHHLDKTSVSAKNLWLRI